MVIKKLEFILYVSNQEISTNFYKAILSMNPCLEVQGMTEFEISSNCRLGLMSEDGISKIIGEKAKHPKDARNIPRCEVYLIVDNILPFYKKAKDLNALLVSEIADRDWGDRVCYFSDPDGHIIAFAER